jgi:hypothetical protein
MQEWLDRYGQLPSSYDWSRTHARRRGGEATQRLESGEWPSSSVVTDVFGTWAAARIGALQLDVAADGVGATKRRMKEAAERSPVKPGN